MTHIYAHKIYRHFCIVKHVPEMFTQEPTSISEANIYLQTRRLPLLQHEHRHPCYSSFKVHMSPLGILFKTWILIQ